MNKIDQKIKGLLSELDVAIKNKNAFTQEYVVDSEKRESTEKIFKMGTVFSEEHRLLVELELAYAEKYQNRYSTEDIKKLQSENIRLTNRSRSFRNNQWPAAHREKIKI